jgi:hypothetical protein
MAIQVADRDWHSRRGRGPRHRPDSTMHPHELTDGIQHLLMESQSQAPVCPFKRDNYGHVDSGDVIRAKQLPTEKLQRTEEYTNLKADNRLRPNLRPLRVSYHDSTSKFTRDPRMLGLERLSRGRHTNRTERSYFEHRLVSPACEHSHLHS